MANPQDYLTNYLNTLVDFRAGLPPAEDNVAQLQNQGYTEAAGADAGIPKVLPPTTTAGDIYVDEAAQAAGHGRYTGDSTAGRTQGQTVTDALVSAANGAVQGIDGLGSLAAGLVSNKAGATVAGWGKSVNDFADGFQSDGLARRREAYAARNEITAARNKALQAQDIQDGDSHLVAGLRRIGRDALSSIHNMDGMTAGDTIAQGAGSFVVGGVVGKGLKALSLGERAAMGLSIGAQEGGGAHQQTVNAVMDMTHKELLEGSKEYRDYLANGMSPDDAKAAVANHAGLMAAAIAAPIGAATGAAFSAGEHNLFHVDSVASGLAKPLIEGAEEFTQSGAGQIGQNLAVRNYANDKQDLLEGVGEQAGQGAVGGLGSGAVFGTPGTAGQIGAAAGRKAFNAVKNVGTSIRDGINSQIDRVQSDVASQSPVAVEQVAPVFADSLAKAADPVVRQNVEQAAAETTKSPEQAKAMVDHFDRLAEAMKLDPTEADQQASPLIADALRSSTDKFDALRNVAAIAGDEKRSPAERVEAGMYLHNAQAQSHSLVQSLDEAIQLTDDHDPRLAPLRQMEDTVLSLTEVPEIRQAIEHGGKLAQLLSTKSLSPENITKPEGQSTVRAAVAASQLDPTSIDPTVANEILIQAKAGKIVLTPAQSNSLQVAADVMQAATDHAKRAKELGVEESPTDFVSKQIRSDRINGDQLSAAQHMQKVMTNMASGNHLAAQQALNNFMLFATHMGNKVEALNNSFETGKPQHAQSLRAGKETWVRSLKPWMVHGHRHESIQFAQTVANDAQTVGSMANILAHRFPELGVSPIETVKLDPRLNGNARDVAFKFRQAAKQGQKIAPIDQPLNLKPVEITEPKPAPKAEPKVETKSDVKSTSQVETLKVEPKVEATTKPEPTPEPKPVVEDKVEPKAEEPKLTPGQEVGQRVLDAGNDAGEAPKKTFQALGDELNALSPKEHAAALGHIEGYENVEPAPSDTLKAIRDTIKELSSEVGIDLSKLINRVFVYDRKDGESAAYHFTGNALSIAREFFTENASKPEALMRLLSHELGHALDWFASPDDLASNIDFFAKNSDLYAEFSKLQQAGVLKNAMSEPLWNYINSSFANTNEEFHAELVSFVLMNPELAKELIPNGEAYVRDLLHHVAEVEGLHVSQGADANPISGTERAPSGETGQEAGSVDPLANLHDDPEVGAPNWFKKSFTLKPDASRLIGMGLSMVDTVRTALASTAAFTKIVGNSFRGSLTPDVVGAYQSVLGAVDTIKAQMDQRLAEALNKTVGKADSPSMKDALLNGGTTRGSVNDMTRTKVFNTLDRTADGEFAYNTALQSSAILAGLQWVLSQSQTGRSMDEDDLLKMLSVKDESEVADDVSDLVDRFNDGIAEELALRSLGQKISKFWGTKEKNDAYIGFADGIPQGMAAEVLAAMRDMKPALIQSYAETVNLIVDGKPETRTYNRLKINADKNVLGIARQQPDLIEQLAVTDPEQTWHIGEAPKKIADRVLRNAQVETTKQQRQMIEHYQNVPSRINEHMLGFLENIGDKLALDLFGAGDINKGTNVNEAKSLAGKNLTISSALETVRELAGNVRNYAEANGVKVGEVPIYHEFNVNRLGRLQMMGKNNEQTSKLMREVSLPTRSVIDLSDTSGKGYETFRLALAQHLGIKVHKLGVEASVAKVDEMLKTPEMTAAVNTLSNWLARSETKKPLQLTAADVAIIKTALGEGAAPAALHSLMEFARYQNAKASGTDVSKFETGLYLEADGVTDGPINAMLHMAQGLDEKGDAVPWFSPQWIDTVSKGGLFIGPEKVSIANYMQSDAENASSDLYEATTDAFRRLRHEYIAQATPEVQGMSKHLITLMSELMPDSLSIQDGQLVIDRKIAKNPLTVTIYSSGADGIAGKFLREIKQSLYNKMSNGGLSSQAMKSFEALTQFVARKGKGDEWLVLDDNNDTFKTKNNDPTTATMTPKMERALRTNIRTMFVAPLVQAINETIGEVRPATKSMQTAIQVQSIFLRSMFEREINELLDQKKKDPNWRETYSLTRGELSDILAKIKHVAPYIETGTQNFLITGSDAIRINKSQVASALDDSFKSDLTMQGPADAGVKGAATMVVGPGDGQMIQNYAVTPGAPASGPVFDGINFGIDAAERGSQLINKAVLDGWLANPISGVSKTYTEALDAMLAEGAKNLSPARLRELERAFRDDQGKGSLDEKMKRLQSELETHSRNLEARKAVLSKVALSVDHMASAEAPHQTQGIPLLGSSEEKADRLNELLKTELENQEAKNIARPKAAPINFADDIVRYESPNFGTDPRLTRIRENWYGKLFEHLKKSSTDEASSLHNLQKAELALTNAKAAADRMVAVGWPNMSMQERSTFEMMVQTLATEAQIDGTSLARMNDLWEHVTANLKPKDFMRNPENPDENDVKQAQDKLNVILGVHGVDTDEQGRSSLLPSFMALAVVNPEVREILRGMPVPRSEKNRERTLDAILENAGQAAVDNVTRLISGEGLTHNIRDAVDALTDRMAASEQEQQSFITNAGGRINDGIGAANDYIVQTADRLALKLENKLDQVKANTDSKAVKMGVEMGKLLTSIVNEDRADKVHVSLMSTLSQFNMNKHMFDFFNEVIGRTSDNAKIYDMIKAVRSFVQRTRQQFRTELPKTIAKQFTRKLEAHEWTALTTGLAKTDLASLDGHLDLKAIRDLMITPSRLTNEISGLEEKVQKVAGKDWSLIQQKAKELAVFMNTGKITSGNLLRNASAIAHLFNEPGRTNTGAVPAATYVKAIDQLTSLYALDGVDAETKSTLAKLASDESQGVEFTMSSLIGQAAGEREKIGSNRTAEFNHYKGHVPSEQQAGVSLIVAPDADHDQLRFRGYQQVQAYKGSAAEGSRQKKSYYFAPVSGRAAFHQGILQNVRQTAYGVDPNTGFTLGRMTASRITEPQLVKDITRRARLNQGAHEPLMPVFDEKGTPIAYERSVDPAVEAKLAYNSHMGELMGIWRGRQMEEITSQHFNENLISSLADKWAEDKTARKGEYLNLFDPKVLKDPIFADAVKLITPESREMIGRHFDDGEFWVRRDMIDDAVGYRAASVGDVWTGNSRMNLKTQEVMKKAATAVFGVDAYKNFVKGERVWQNIIGDARTTIVVKSVVVPIANILSNVLHKLSVGVPAGDIWKGMTSKAVETNIFARNQLRQTQLEAELFNARANKDLVTIRRVETSIQSIDDANRRLSIWPLIEAGEFSAVTEDGINHDDLLLTTGKLNAFLEKSVDKLPDSVKTMGRYAIVSQDTALFKGLQRAVQYGDFLSKAVLYDHLVKRKGNTSEQALGKISEEFINFDRAAGRGRSYLESMGLMWFWHFKIRSIKIAMSTIRNNPLQLFLTHLIPLPDTFGSIGSPVSDNLISNAWNSKLGYSLGPGQAWRAYMLNPGVNIFT